MKKIITALLGIIILLVILNAYSFIFDDKRTSHSYIERYNNYYAINDWNLPASSVKDFDKDGNNDAINWDGCIYLSSFNTQDYSSYSTCEISLTDSRTHITTPKIGIQLPYGFLSFIATNSSDNWTFHTYTYRSDVNIYEISNGALIPITPSLKDKLDRIIYIISHSFLINVPRLFW